MKKKFLMVLMSAMMVTGNMSMVHAEDLSDVDVEIIDVSDEKLTVDDDSEVTPRMDSLNRLFVMNYKSLAKGERVTTVSSGKYFDPNDIETKAIHVTVRPDTDASSSVCSLEVGIGYPISGGSFKRNVYSSFSSYYGGSTDLALDDRVDFGQLQYGYVQHTTGSGLAYGTVHFDEYIDW